MATEERLCSVQDVKPGEARRFDVGRIPVCLARIEDAWYAINDTCTHQKISLSEGEMHPETLEIECWKHGSCFSLVDGRPNTLPATKAVAVYDVRIDGDDVLVVIP